MPTPIHWRAPTLKPNSRSAITASSTTPVESTAWTTDIGAKARAATWKNQALVATAMPIANHLEEKSSLTERSGWRMSTCGSLIGSLVLVKEAQLRDDGARSARNMPRFNMRIEEGGPARSATAPWPTGQSLHRYSRPPP